MPVECPVVDLEEGVGVGGGEGACGEAGVWGRQRTLESPQVPVVDESGRNRNPVAGRRGVFDPELQAPSLVQHDCLGGGLEQALPSDVVVSLHPEFDQPTVAGVGEYDGVVAVGDLEALGFGCHRRRD